MSNYDLQAEVSRLRSILADVQRENSRLTGEINQGVSTVNESNRRINQMTDNVNSTLGRSADNLKQAQSNEEAALGIQDEIERQYPLFKNMEEANKNIRELKNKIYYDFATYRKVRKIMQGYMDNLDLSIINDELIYKAVEKSHLQSSDYWLTSAMLAIMAWKNDQKAMAERAVREAFDLDRKNTIMFFMIFNLRMGRDETALNWFLEYEKCDMTGEDRDSFLMMFSLISKTVMENVNPEVRARITDFIDRTIRESTQAEGYSENDLANRIAARLLTLKKTGTYNTPHLATCMKGYKDFTNTLDMAANNSNILDRVASIINASVAERNKYLKEYMDKLLAKPNDMEKDTYDQIRFNELVIKNRGNMEAANEEYRVTKEEDAAQINLVSNMVDWIGDDANEFINGQMRLNMFSLISGCEQNGTKRYAENYRARYKEVWPVTVGEYSTTCNFQDQQTENGKIGVFYQEWLTNQLSQINDKASYILFALAAVVFGVGIYLVVKDGVVKNLLITAAVSLLMAAAGGMMIYFNKKKRENLTVEAGKRTESTQRDLDVLFREFDVLRQKYREFDAVTADIDELFTQV